MQHLQCLGRWQLQHMRQAGYSRIDLYHTAMGTMVALLAAAVMRMFGMSGRTMRAMVLQCTTTTGGCHYYGGNQAEHISQARMRHCCITLFCALQHCCFNAHALQLPSDASLHEPPQAQL